MARAPLTCLPSPGRRHWWASAWILSTVCAVTSVTASATWPARLDSSLLRAPSPAATNAPTSSPVLATSTNGTSARRASTAAMASALPCRTVTRTTEVRWLGSRGGTAVTQPPVDVIEERISHEPLYGSPGVPLGVKAMRTRS